MGVVVYAPGVWDLLHVGHVKFLLCARSYGTELVVGVPSDGVVVEDKGELPIITGADRLRMVLALHCVDRAELYTSFEFLTHLRKFQPQVLAVGSEWGGAKRHIDAENWCVENGCKVVRIPRSEGISTSIIKERIRSQ